MCVFIQSPLILSNNISVPLCVLEKHFNPLLHVLTFGIELHIDYVNFSLQSSVLSKALSLPLPYHNHTLWNAFKT